MKIYKILFIILCILGISSPLFAVKALLLTQPKTGTNLGLKLLRNMLDEKQHIHVGALSRAVYWGHQWKLKVEPYGRLEPNPNKIEILKKEKVKLILLLRDPRQHIIALLRSIHKPINHSTIEWGIHNYPRMLKEQTGSPCFLRYKDINECYQCYLRWVDEYSDVYVTYFEKLVGPRGGGSQEQQYEEIQRIAEFLEIELSDARLYELAHALFGGTPTFQQGQSNTWRKYFSKKNIELFKQVAGDLLIQLGYEEGYDW